MKKVIIISTFILLFNLHTKAQYDYFDNEIGINVGTSFWEDDQVITCNIDYARFITPNIGIRSGAIVYASEFMNAGWGMKIPAYASFRTGSSKTEYDPYDARNMDDSFGESILYSILGQIPLNFEVNLGPSFGYLATTKWTKRLTNEEKSKRMQYYPHARLMVTLDANIRLCFNIERVGIVITGGGAYSLTNNFKYYSARYDSDNGKVARWSGTIMAGLTYKF